MANWRQLAPVHVWLALFVLIEVCAVALHVRELLHSITRVFTGVEGVAPHQSCTNEYLHVVVFAHVQ